MREQGKTLNRPGERGQGKANDGKKNDQLLRKKNFSGRVGRANKKKGGGKVKGKPGWTQNGCHETVKKNLS